MKYSIIYADPPWAPRNKGVKGAASQQYPVMTVGQICALPVKDIAADDSFLLMWWLASMPEEALQVVKAWGFKFHTMTCFSWIKQTLNKKTGKIRDHFGMGFSSRQNQEQVLIAKRGRAKVVAHNVEQNVRALVTGHSRKPSEMRDRIIQLCGDLPRIELFAREIPPGWGAWGNEIGTTDVDLLNWFGR